LDLFAHVLAAGLVAEAVARAPRLGRPRGGMRVAAAVALGAASHLALDAVPHFGFLPHLFVWTWMPHAWLVRPLVGGLITFLALVLKGGSNWPLVVAACVGAVYPDVEKIAHSELGVPFVLFRGHAEVVTTYTAGLPPKLLAASEIALAALFAALYARLATRREAGARTPPR